MAPEVTARALLGPRARLEERPGEPLFSVPGEAVAELAAALDCSLRRAEVRALEAGYVPRRYLRNMAEFSLAEQVALLRARGLLVGLGGLGGFVLDGLVRAGFGRLAVCDPDRFEESNLNRQVLCTRGDIGRSKAAAAADHAYDVNPAVEVTMVPGRFEAGADGLPDQPDLRAALENARVAVDALGGLDEADGRAALGRAAALARVPLVSAGAAGMAGWVATVPPGGPVPADFMGGGSGGAELRLGTPAPAVALAAAVQVAEILALGCGRTPALLGRVLLFDLTAGSFETVTL